MMKPLQVLVTVVVVAISLVSTGCASFKKNQLPEISGFAAIPPESVKPSATYSFVYTHNVFGEGQASESTRAIMSQEFARVLTESAQFASVIEAGNGGDVHLDVQLHNYGNPAAVIPAFITGFSFFTIPSWATDHWRVTAAVAKSGSDPRTYTFEDADVLVQWLPMIFAMPFNSIWEVIPEVRKNIYKNLVKTMKDNGDL